MKSFRISRIHTPGGIFRLSGHYGQQVERLSNTQSHAAQIVYEKVEFMGSDGWCELDLHNPHAQSVLANIEEEIRAHLDKRRFSE